MKDRARNFFTMLNNLPQMQLKQLQKQFKKQLKQLDTLLVIKSQIKLQKLATE